MKAIKLMLLFVGVFIITLHSIVPHFHDDELGVEKHADLHSVPQESLLDYLSLFFHETTEDGQLDNFVSSAEAHFNFISVSAFCCVIPEYLEIDLLKLKKRFVLRILCYNGSEQPTIHTTRPPPLL